MHPNSRGAELIPPIGASHSFLVLGCRVAATYHRRAKLLRLTNSLSRTLVCVVSENRRAHLFHRSLIFSSNCLTATWEGRSKVEEASHQAMRRHRRRVSGDLKSEKPDLTRPLALKSDSLLLRHSRRSRGQSPTNSY